eukprot:TRINITY_DN4322_c0_g1_i1.p3 TRINITY_DN4322_c0_g1~~TRINITY_DN4322_c0_g1_i1.p3  ORF type:complete len:141 (+),score=1.52 TRINITY_DN4322_c0_g1_i1:142-564(+)
MGKKYYQLVEDLSFIMVFFLHLQIICFRGSDRSLCVLFHLYNLQLVHFIFFNVIVLRILYFLGGTVYSWDSSFLILFQMQRKSYVFLEGFWLFAFLNAKLQYCKGFLVIDIAFFLLLVFFNYQVTFYEFVFILFCATQKV